MCFMRPEHFIGVLLFLCIYCNLCFNSVTYAASLNTSEEIKRIFNGDRDVRNATVSVAKVVSLSGIFAEGGQLDVSSMTTGNPTKKNDTLYTSHVNTPVTEIIFNSNNSNYKNSTLPKLSPSKTLPTKLNDTGSNLFLGVPEVIHINGTSSIKPRKGVYYNKIVPRKGVENNSDENHSDSCAWLGKNECYYSKDLTDIDCNCCKEGNDLGKSIRKKDHVECKNCKSVIVDFPDEKHICKNICCYDKSHKAASDTENFYKNLTFTKIKKENFLSYGKIKDAGFSNVTKSSKHKPSITKVPYDVETVTEILSKAKQKVFVPVLVSILLLPLIGILVFVVLRKTKEIWDKRYYKRMDFLIDGMYQD